MSLASHHVFTRLNLNTMQSDRVFSFNRKEVCFKTGFSLAAFSMKPAVESAEQGD